MKSILLAFAICLSLNSFSQQVCNEVAVANCWDTQGSWYFIVPETFVNKIGIKRGVNQFNAVRTCAGCLVTSVNSINEFPDLFKEFNNENLNLRLVWLPLCNFRDCLGGGDGGTPTPTAYNTLSLKKWIGSRPNIASIRVQDKVYASKK